MITITDNDANLPVTIKGKKTFVPKNVATIKTSGDYFSLFNGDEAVIDYANYSGITPVSVSANALAESIDAMIESTSIAAKQDIIIEKLTALNEKDFKTNTASNACAVTSLQHGSLSTLITNVNAHLAASNKTLIDIEFFINESLSPANCCLIIEK